MEYIKMDEQSEKRLAARSVSDQEETDDEGGRLVTTKRAANSKKNNNSSSLSSTPAAVATAGVSSSKHQQQQQQQHSQDQPIPTQSGVGSRQELLRGIDNPCATDSGVISGDPSSAVMNPHENNNHVMRFSRTLRQKLRANGFQQVINNGTAAGTNNSITNGASNSSTVIVNQNGKTGTQSPAVISSSGLSSHGGGRIGAERQISESQLSNSSSRMVTVVQNIYVYVVGDSDASTTTVLSRPIRFRPERPSDRAFIDDDNPKYRTCCHHCHVTRTVFIIGLIEMVFALMHLVDAVRQTIQNGSLAPTFFELSVAVCFVTAVLLMIYGVRSERKAFLIPHLVWSVVCIVLPIIFILMFIIVYFFLCQRDLPLQRRILRTEQGTSNWEQGTANFIVTDTTFLAHLLVYYLATGQTQLESQIDILDGRRMGGGGQNRTAAGGAGTFSGPSPLGPEEFNNEDYDSEKEELFEIPDTSRFKHRYGRQAGMGGSHSRLFARRSKRQQKDDDKEMMMVQKGDSSPRPLKVLTKEDEEMAERDDQETKDSIKQSLWGIIIVILIILLLVLALQIWAFIIIRACYQYLKDKEAYLAQLKQEGITLTDKPPAKLMAPLIEASEIVDDADDY